MTVIPVRRSSPPAPAVDEAGAGDRDVLAGRALAADAGLVEVTVGAALTVKTSVPVAVLPSPLVTVTLRRPVLAWPAIVMLAVSVVALT